MKNKEQHIGSGRWRYMFLCAVVMWIVTCSVICQDIDATGCVSVSHAGIPENDVFTRGGDNHFEATFPQTVTAPPPVCRNSSSSRGRHVLNSAQSVTRIVNRTNKFLIDFKFHPTYATSEILFAPFRCGSATDFYVIMLRRLLC